MTDNDKVRVLHGTETEEQLRSTEVQTTQERMLTGQQEMHTHTQGVAQVAQVGEVGRLQLLEERASVQVLREGVGQVQIRKVVRERQEMVPVTVTTEVLEITVKPVAQAAATTGTQTELQSGTQGIGQIVIDGKPLTVGQTFEIPLTEERVQVVKQVYPINEVVVRKKAQTTTHQEAVTLRREELDVVDAQGLAQVVDGTLTDTTLTDELKRR